VSGSLGRRCAGEALGTLILVLFGAGSVVAAAGMAEEGELTYPALGMVALAFGLAVAIAVYAFGTTSGAHINPAVTVALTAVRRFPAAEVAPYVAAQVAGALAGALLIVAAFGQADAVDLAATGGTELADGVSFLQGVVAEAVGTFLLLVAIMALAVDRRAPAGWAGLMIGLAVTTAILLIAPLTGGSINPARTFGPLLTTGLFGGEAAWGDLPVYLIGPLVGAVAAAIAYDAIARPRDHDAAEAEPAQGTQGDIEGRRDSGRAAEPRPAGGRQGAQGAIRGTRRLQ
jgi:glycerol uptake facilitator protein